MSAPESAYAKAPYAYVFAMTLLGLHSQSAMAQSGPQGGQQADTTVADVVVEGETPLTQAAMQQSTPSAATIITRQQIQNNNIINLENAKQLVPSLQVRMGNPGVVNVNIRGFGQAYTSFADTIRSGVPIYVDGVYQPRAAVASFGIPDLNMVDVLKGPQATSGGIESTGGIVNISTELPSFVAQQSLEFSYGSYNLKEFKGSVTGPIDKSDWAAFRIGIVTSDRDGYLRTIDGLQNLNSWHSDAIRGQLLLSPSQDLTARIIADFAHMFASCCVSVFAGAVPNYANGAPVPNNYYTRAGRIGYVSQTVPFSRPDVSTFAGIPFGTGQETFGLSGKVEYLLNGYIFSSLTSFRGWDFHPHYWGNGVISPQVMAANYGYPRELSAEQEFQISTPKGQPYEATFGLNYFWESYHKWSLTQYGPLGGAWFGNASYSSLVNNTALNGFGRFAYDNPMTHSIAPYIRTLWHATPNLDITLGLRYTYTAQTTTSRWYWAYGSDLSFLSAAQQAQAIALRTSNLGASYSSFTATTRDGLISAFASAQYHFTPDVNGYVTYSRGGHAGGVNFVVNLPAAAPRTIRPEILDNYEVGLKSTWFDNRLIANIAAFYMVNHDYITTVTDSTGPTVISYLANAKRAISRGVELDLHAQITDAWSAFGSLTYDDAYYGSFDNAPCPFELSYMSSCNFTGKPLAMTPRWAMAAGTEYREKLETIFPELAGSGLSAYIAANFSWQSAFYSNSDNSIYSLIKPYGLLNLRSGISNDLWDLSVWAKNALNSRYYITISAATNIAAGAIGGTVGDPLMVGFTYRMKL